MIPKKGRTLTYWELRARISFPSQWHGLYDHLRIIPYLMCVASLIDFAIGGREESAISSALLGICAAILTVLFEPSGFVARRFPVPCDPGHARDYLRAEHVLWLKHVKIENITKNRSQEFFLHCGLTDPNIVLPLVRELNSLDKLFDEWCTLYENAIRCEFFPRFAHIESLIEKGVSLERIEACIKDYEARREHFELVRAELDVFIGKLNGSNIKYDEGVASLVKLNQLLLSQLSG